MTYQISISPPSSPTPTCYSPALTPQESPAPSPRETSEKIKDLQRVFLSPNQPSTPLSPSDSCTSLSPRVQAAHSSLTSTKTKPTTPREEKTPHSTDHLLAIQRAGSLTSQICHTLRMIFEHLLERQRLTPQELTEVRNQQKKGLNDLTEALDMPRQGALQACLQQPLTEEEQKHTQFLLQKLHKQLEEKGQEGWADFQETYKSWKGSLEERLPTLLLVTEPLMAHLTRSLKVSR